MPIPDYLIACLFLAVIFAGLIGGVAWLGEKVDPPKRKD